MAAKTWNDMRGDTFDSREIIERIEELESAITFSDPRKPIRGLRARVGRGHRSDRQRCQLAADLYRLAGRR